MRLRARCWSGIRRGALPKQGVDMGQRMREDAAYWNRRLGVAADFALNGSHPPQA